MPAISTPASIRFGRVVDQFWVQSGTVIDRFTYGYDADANVLFSDNESPRRLHIQ